jgi:hypothetical protein
MGISNNFNDETETAGYDRLNSFLRRNTKLSVRQAEGLYLHVLLFELSEYFQRAASLPDRRGVFTGMSGRDAAKTFFAALYL